MTLWRIFALVQLRQIHALKVRNSVGRCLHYCILKRDTFFFQVAICYVF